MPNDIKSMLSGAKNALEHANKAFPSPKPAAAPAAPKMHAAPEKPAGVGEELKVKQDNVKTYMDSLPKMHDGGPVAADGAYMLKAGEHVLTQPQAKMARKHAMMSVGMHRLSMPGAAPTAGQPKAVDAAHKTPEKKNTSDIKVRPEKNQSAKISIKKK